MSKNVGNQQFHVMCEMWGVDEAVKVAKRMGMNVTKDQINNEQKEEAEKNKRLTDAFKRIREGE